MTDEKLTNPQVDLWMNSVVSACFPRKNIKASAICRYAFSDVQKVFDGPYMEVQDSKWREYTGRVPEPRPGSVGFQHTLSLSMEDQCHSSLITCALCFSAVYYRCAQVPEHQHLSGPPR